MRYTRSLKLLNLISGDSLTEQMLFILFWLVVAIGSVLYVVRHGPYYVNQPMLVRTLDKDLWLEEVYCI